MFATFVSYLALEICLDVFVQERYQEDINRMYGPWAQTRWRKTEENCFDFWTKLQFPTDESVWQLLKFQLIKCLEMCPM